MSKRLFAVIAVVAVGLSSTAFIPAHAAAEKTVGGAPMYPTKNIIENAVNSKDHTTLVAAVKAAGLVDPARSPCSRRPTWRSASCRPAPSIIW
jgi:uncharacterized surface protein with fasciclin (FAS1) repeats